MVDVKGKTVIITGGGTGIGYGVATAFAKEGAELTITGRREQPLLDAKKTLEDEFGAKVLAISADGTDEDAVQGVIDKTVAEYGKIDVVINNAQASKSGIMLADHSKEDFDLAINTGLYGVFFYMRSAFPYLKENKGTVINFASGAGLSGKVGQSSYAAAKEGIRGLTRVAANEWGEFGINANIVCPLAMTERLMVFKEEYPDVYEQTIKGVPLQRFADPEMDIGKVCLFLASDDASFITGETISVQGGVGLRP